MKIVFSKKCLEYGKEGHPESPERLRNIHEFLGENYRFIEAKPCQKKDLFLAHTKKLVDNVRSGSFFDADTPNIPNIYYYAKLSAGAAVQTAKLALREKAFSLMRPPGHHAGRGFLGGFCYFNNIAIAVSKSKKRTAILDIDVHHGNGTQNIFLGNKNVLYVSLHQSPLYPGSGLVSEKNCINYPLPPGTSENIYLKTLRNALEKIKKFRPEVLAISIGFDTYKLDPLANLNLERETYKKIGNMISNLCDVGIFTFAVLEGGYSKDLKLCISEFLRGYE